MPGGNAWRILPFGPCTSTAPSTTLTVTPLGIAMGFLPIRDMVPTRCSLPDVAKHFAADARFHGRLPGHHTARRRQDAGAQTSQHLGHIVAAEIDAAARAADPLDAGNQAFTMRTVFQEHAEQPARRALAVRF